MDPWSLLQLLSPLLQRLYPYPLPLLVCQLFQCIVCSATIIIFCSVLCTMYIRMSNGNYSRRFHMGYPIFIPLRLRYHLCQRVHLFAIIISPFRHYHITFASFSICSFPTITSHRKIIVFICAFKFFLYMSHVLRIPLIPPIQYSTVPTLITSVITCASVITWASLSHVTLL